MFRGTFWTHGRTNVAEISPFGEVVRHSGLFEIHSFEFYSRFVSHRELLAKIPSLQLAPAMALFQSLLKIRDRIGEDRNKDRFKIDSFAVLESFRFVTKER